ncbi:MAG: endo alpha-1,4 polygalactosaminidase [Propionibacteriales bacterium]|nr:endo alpha-1,4 polygalactosaminidase [Propionibacteriales bacterium]
MPPADAGFDYQLGGSYRLPPAVRVVTRARTSAPAPGAYNICYVNGFQTQPGRLDWWRGHHGALLLRDRRGALVRDPGWPAEVLLDVSSPRKRRHVAAVVGGWTQRCADDGFDAVEPDNLDSFTRSRHLLSRSDNLALADLLADRAHGAGLAIAQKNLAAVTRRMRHRIGFDFAVSEECSVWDECASYRAAYGRHVLEIEYTDNGRRPFARVCRRHGDEWSIVLRDRMLQPPTSPRYVYDRC